VNVGFWWGLAAQGRARVVDVRPPPAVGVRVGGPPVPVRSPDATDQARSGTGGPWRGHWGADMTPPAAGSPVNLMSGLWV
jgi:hypothetical protein